MSLQSSEGLSTVSSVPSCNETFHVMKRQYRKALRVTVVLHHCRCERKVGTDDPSSKASRIVILSYMWSR
jgi:hypothetical protein